MLNSKVKRFSNKQSSISTPKSYQATVKRVDETGTLWVAIDGGNSETPCITTTASAVAGDRVMVTIQDHKAYVAGNTTRPATDDSATLLALDKATKAALREIEAAKRAALACPFPIGTILHLATGMNPNRLYPDTRWVTVANGRVLIGEGALDNDHKYQLGKYGGEPDITLSAGQIPKHSHTIAHTHSTPNHTHGLNNHTHSVPAHAHGLNNHTHSVPAHAHGLNNHTHTTPNHTHTVPDHIHKVRGSTTGGLKYGLVNHFDTGRPASEIPSFGGNVATNNVNGGDLNLPSGGKCTIASSGGGTSGKASGNTANSSALTSGGAGGNTANSSVLTSGGAGGNTASGGASNTGAASVANTGTYGGDASGNTASISNMQPYWVVAMWQRVA